MPNNTVMFSRSMAAELRGSGKTVRCRAGAITFQLPCCAELSILPSFIRTQRYFYKGKGTFGSRAFSQCPPQ